VSLRAGGSKFTTPRVLTQKNTVMSPVGPETKNDCAVEGQHKFTQPNRDIENGNIRESPSLEAITKQ
jgi:hypothetical protein